MPHIPKAPAACADLHLGVVSRTLAKHYGDIPASARELGVSAPDLNHLIWSRPRLLEEAEVERMVVIDGAIGVLIDGLRSDDPKRQLWAAERILSSNLARGHPFSPANRCEPARKPEIAISWAFDNREVETFERDGQIFEVPKYGRDDVIEGELATPPELIRHGVEPVVVGPAEPPPAESESAARERFDAWIRARVIPWSPQSCLRCRKPLLAGVDWVDVVGPDGRARLHRSCRDEWREEARRALGLPIENVVGPVVAEPVVSEPKSAELLVWNDPHSGPPPLVAHLYQPHVPRPRGGPPQPREARKIIYE